LGPQQGWEVPIVKTEAVRGEGTEQLAEALAEHHAYVEAEGTLSQRRRRNLMNEVLALAAFRMRRELEASVRDDPATQELLDRVVARELDPASAANAVLERRAEELAAGNPTQDHAAGDGPEALAAGNPTEEPAR
ncbi:MAG: hypothetical protein JO262_01000, partial [Solirubrobacterales bacterium]|nr:hypothetical protein [Solirubrobacterales bacterium]